MRNEAEFRKHVTKLVEDAGGHVSNIESHLTAAGVPDMNICLHGQDVWLELKYKGKSMKMRPTQRRWHRTRAACGGTSWVVVYDPEDAGVWFVPGHVAAEHPDLRQFPFDTVAKHSATIIRTVVKSIIKGKYDVRRWESEIESPDSDGSPQNPGGSETALRESGQNVVGHHWLLDKP